LESEGLGTDLYYESFGPRQSIIAYQPVGFDILHLAIIM
jgi:hypothetical protein